VAIVFPFSVDDKESNSSGDGKAKSSPTAASNSSNNSKNVNSIFNDSTTTDKANSTSKSSTPSSIAPNSEQTVTNCAKSADSASEPAAKANNCDLSNDVMNNVIDTSGIKLEIKDDPDAPKVTKSVNNIQPAMGGSLLPPHASSAKHPVSIFQDFPLFASCIGGFMTGSEMLRGWEVSSRKKNRQLVNVFVRHVEKERTRPERCKQRLDYLIVSARAETKTSSTEQLLFD
jgi:hypothetical protein